MKIYLLVILSIISISHPNFVFSNDLTDLEGKLLICKEDRGHGIDVNLRFINRKYVLFERIGWNHTEKYNYYRFEKPRENYIPHMHINYTNGSCPTEYGAGNRTTYYKLRGGDGLSLEHCDRGSWMKVSFCKIKGNIDKDELKLLLKIYGDKNDKQREEAIRNAKNYSKQATKSKDCNSNNLTYFELNQCEKKGKLPSTKSSAKKNNSDIKKTKQERKISEKCSSNNLTYFEWNQCEKGGKITSSSRLPNTSYARIDSEVGCQSRYSDQKKRDIFNSEYKGKSFRWSGTVRNPERGSTSLDIDGRLSDIKVYFNDGQTGYDLLKGETITVVFKMHEMGGCVLPFIGRNAYID